MTAFVEECRHEWRRLGVPDLLAEEMATELESDLAEAEADGVSATEMLGESDPRRFAAAWARERGLVSAPAPRKRRTRRWIWATAGFILALVFVVVLGLVAAVGASVRYPHLRVSREGPVGRDPEPRRAEGLSRQADRAGVRPSDPEGAAAPLQGSRRRSATAARDAHRVSATASGSS